MFESYAETINRELYDLDCVLEGKYFFALENKRVATTFIDPRAIYTKPELVEVIAAALTHHFSSTLLKDVEVVAAPSIQITPLAHAVARRFPRYGLTVPDVVFVEAGKNSYRFDKRFESVVDGRPTLLVDDIVFTGYHLLKAAEVIQKAGGKIVGAAALIRYEGINIEDVLMPVFPALPRIVSYGQNEHPDWGTWPLVTDYGHPEKFPNYFGPTLTLK